MIACTLSRNFNSTLVRLKVFEHIGLERGGVYFNSTLVRLKACYSCTGSLIYDYFNSTLVRLKD